jgi:membrane-associated phospholipid phosphatase
VRSGHSRSRLTALTVAALLAGAGLSLLAVSLPDGPTSIDKRVRRRVLRVTTRRGRALTHLLTGPGHPSVYFPATALMVAALRRRGVSGSQALIFAAVGGWATHRVVKLFVRRRRPRTMHGRSNEYEAFPSGHTTASTAIALTAAYVFYRRRMIAPSSAIALAALTPLSIGAGRVLADQHWSTDVIGGWVGGAGMAAIAALAFERD